MQVAFEILWILHDGKFHSGSHLAQHLKVSRSSIWKAIDFLRNLGVQIQAVSGKGYRWPNPFELIDKHEINKNLTVKTQQAFKSIDVVNVLASTNDYLISRLNHDIPSGSVCIAQAQTAGKGRMGRTWCSPFGANIYLSFYWRFDCKLHDLSGLSLVIALALLNALQEIFYLPKELGIKWPNDIWFKEKKLCGILIESMSQATAKPYSDVIIGIGMNVNMPPDKQEPAWTDLHEVCGVVLSRNQLIASLLNSLASMLECFEREGFSAFTHLWAQFDLLKNKKIELSTPKLKQHGIAQGVNDRGELCVQIGETLKAIRYGEVSIRPD